MDEQRVFRALLCTQPEAQELDMKIKTKVRGGGGGRDCGGGAIFI